jgi:prepilin-type N-terminal cleavage/methylation domain-containing protein
VPRSTTPYFSNKPCAGFTLLEMAVVLVIIGLLLAGLMMPLSAQLDQRRIEETRKAMDEINQAIYGFALANGRLPCPANPTVASGTAGAGTETNTGPSGSCINNPGVVPWATLGLSETDAWNRRYTYRVTGSFADGLDGAGLAGATGPCGTPRTGVSFELCSTGDDTVLAATAGATLASGIPAVIVSHGQNGLGGYTSAGTQIAGAAGEEANNTGGTIIGGATVFISHTPTATFDDLVTWLSPNTLMNRMVTGGRLP